ncbi:DUF2971 domain-containing protein [Bifidobacterium pullorum]|uniref:DUF2971 domain-containing protein n=1 Tax=Bifidobacterium pullorum TaxID=78448 RepID=UPI003F524D54
MPLWNMYTRDMHGIRIRLPEYPFMKYEFRKGEYPFREDVKTYIDFRQINKEDKLSITANGLQLIDIEYTDDKQKLFPRVKRESYPNLVKDYLDDKPVKGKFAYLMDNIGRYKRLNWSFQKECRYRIIALPMGYYERQEMDDPNKELIRRIENPSGQLQCNQLFMPP